IPLANRQSVHSFQSHSKPIKIVPSIRQTPLDVSLLPAIADRCPYASLTSDKTGYVPDGVVAGAQRGWSAQMLCAAAPGVRCAGFVRAARPCATALLIRLPRFVYEVGG